jgi:acyl carrier protein
MVEKIIAATLKINIDSIKDNMKFIEDLGGDSLHVVELVMAVEEEYDIQISDEEAEALHTVGELKKYIEDNA